MKELSVLSGKIWLICMTGLSLSLVSLIFIGMMSFHEFVEAVAVLNSVLILIFTTMTASELIHQHTRKKKVNAEVTEREVGPILA